MKNRLNNQEKFWKGNFGKGYIKRNFSKKIQTNTDKFFKKIFFQNKNIKIKSLIELGSNIGNNINSIQKLFKYTKVTAVEINKDACEVLRIRNPKINIINTSIEKLKIRSKYDLVLVKGVLIHINPNQLKDVYKKIFNLSKKYILIAEYYSPYPTKLVYRGVKNKLFKRDFVGEILKKYNVKLIDYGFTYRYDKYPQDDINWFLLKKN